MDKSEFVRIGADGDWSDDLKLTVRFANDGAALPPVQSTGAAVGELITARGALSSATLRVDANHFDRAQIGDAFDLKVLPPRNGLSVVRPPDVSTRSLLPSGTLEWGIPVAALLFVGLRLRHRRLGVLILIGLALAAFAYPLFHADQVWREREDLTGATQRATATVVDLTHVTQISLFRSNRSDDRHDVPQPYDIVQLELHVPGFPGPVTAVDAIDTSTASPITVGQTVAVVYPPDFPHGARIEGQARTHYWRTMLGVYTDYALYLAVLVGLVLVWAFVSRRYRASSRRKP